MENRRKHFPSFSLENAMTNLVPKAESQDLLPHGVEPPEQGQQPEDPGVAAVSVVAAAGDDEAVVELDLLVGRELAGGDPVPVPGIAVVAEEVDVDFEEPAVLLPRVVGVLGADQNGEPPPPALPHLHYYMVVR